MFPLAIALAFGGVLTGRDCLWGDFASFYLPAHHYAAERLWTGALPLWNPYVEAGMPFLAEADHGTLYPPALVLHLFGRDPVVLFRLLELFTLGHVLLAMASMYAWARSLGRSRPAAAVAGLAFGMGGIFAARISHVSLVTAQAWTPAVLGGIHRGILHRSPSSFALTAVGLGMMALTGSPATLVVAVVGSVVVAAATIAFAPSVRSLGGATLAAARAGGAIALGVALGAVQLLPMHELGRHSERSSYSYTQVAEFSVTPGSLVMMLVPRFYGYLDYATISYWGPPNFAEISGYAGVAPLLLLGLGVAGRWRRAGPWVVLAATSLWLALGAHAGLHHLFWRSVPVLGEMRAPGRFLLLWGAAVALLAAFGLDRLRAGLCSRRHASASRRRCTSLVLAITMVAVTLALVAPALLGAAAEWKHPFVMDGLARTLTSLALTAVAFGFLRHSPRAGANVLPVLLTVDLGLQWSGTGVMPGGARDEITSAPAAYLEAVRDEVRRDRSRVRSRYRNPGSLWLAGVRSDWGAGRHLAAYRDYVERISSLDSPLLDALAVSHVAQPRESRRLPPSEPNLVPDEILWLPEGREWSLGVDPPRTARALELVVTCDPRGLPPESKVGEIDVVAPDGSSRTVPLRLSIETGDMSGHRVPRDASMTVPAHHVHHRDATSLLRAYYRFELELDGSPLAAIRVRGRPPATLVVKELRLVRGTDQPDTPWHLVASAAISPGRTMDLWDNRDARPRAWMTRRFVFAGSSAEALRRITSGFDTRHDAVIEVPAGQAPSGYPPSGLGRNEGWPPGEAVVVAADPEICIIDAHAEGAGGWLVTSDADYPGWRAEIDGVPTPIARADGLFRAVWVPPGRHRISFRYRPWTVLIGLSISAAAVLAMAGGVLARRRLRRVPASGSAPAG